MNLIPVTTPEVLERCYPVLRELRETLTFQEFLSIHDAAKDRDDYTLIGAFEGDRCIAVMGYRILFDYVHGKHLCIGVDRKDSQRFYETNGWSARAVAYKKTL